MDKFAEGQPILVYPVYDKDRFPTDFAEVLTEALESVGIDWEYA